MNLRPWKLWALDGSPAPGTERDRRRARVGAPPRARITSAPTTTTSTPSRRRGIPSARSRARSGWRRSCPPRAISCTCRRTSTRGPATTRRRAREPGRRGGRPRVPQDGARGQPLRDDVLLPQSAFPRRLAHDAGPSGGREAGRPNELADAPRATRDDDADGGVDGGDADVGATAIRAA